VLARGGRNFGSVAETSRNLDNRGNRPSRRISRRIFTKTDTKRQADPSSSLSPAFLLAGQELNVPASAIRTIERACISRAFRRSVFNSWLSCSLTPRENCRKKKLPKRNRLKEIAGKDTALLT